jgi:protein-tyrosine-phosphatase
MKAFNIDLGQHRATPIDELDINGFDVIVAMDPQVLKALDDKKVSLQNVRNAFVDDPFDSDTRRYEECADAIGRELEKLGDSISDL